MKGMCFSFLMMLVMGSAYGIICTSDPASSSRCENLNKDNCAKKSMKGGDGNYYNCRWNKKCVAGQSCTWQGRSSDL